MVYVINLADIGNSGVSTYGYTTGIPSHASLLQKLETEEQNDEIILYGLPTGQANVFGVEYLNGMPKNDAILLFFLNYWYIPALIILAIIMVAAL